MVLEIRLSNFFSISEEIILDLRAGNIKSQKARSLPENVFSYDKIGVTKKEEIDVLKTLAIYGANASGKSNLIKAIRFCNAMVFESHNHNENTLYAFKPFKFGSWPNKPSTYFIRFVIKEIEYEYSFSLTRKEIITESLYHYPHGRKAKIFERNEKAGKKKRDKYTFGSSWIRRPLDVAENTSNKTLYLSRASQMDRHIPQAIFHYFHQTFILDTLLHEPLNVKRLIEQYKDQLLQALQFADSDIIDFSLQYKSEARKRKNFTINPVSEEVSISNEDGVLESFEIKTYHKNAPKIQFDFFSEESSGTRILFLFMLTVLNVVDKNKILLIDEIEQSLHPHIVDYIIQLFHTSHKAQLIFSTHNTNLLNLNKFRKDQIWFVNKKEDGGTDLYSLYDYSDFRDTMDLEKAYLQGRFDAIPIMNDSHDNLQTLVHG